MKVPSLPLLTYLPRPDAAEWLRTSLTTFAKRVASFLPGHFAAYVRIYHPFSNDGGVPVIVRTWREVAQLAHRDLPNAADAVDFAMGAVSDAQAPTGTLPVALIDRMLPHLRPATTTPDACVFAAWEGYGACIVPRTTAPALELPGRRYHLFAGPLTAARTSYSSISFSHQSANLWWPDDHAWCVATEVDSAWTHVGGSRALIDAMLADQSLEAVETLATSRW